MNRMGAKVRKLTHIWYFDRRGNKGLSPRMRQMLESYNTGRYSCHRACSLFTVNAPNGVLSDLSGKTSETRTPLFSPPYSCSVIK